MAAMFWNFRFLLIFVDRSLLRCAIWLCIYWRNVREVQRPIFIIVVSDAPLSLRAIAPPALKE